MANPKMATEFDAALQKLAAYNVNVFEPQIERRVYLTCSACGAINHNCDCADFTGA